MEPIRYLYYDDDYLMCVRNWVHYGVAAPVLTADQKEAGRKRMREEWQAERERESQPGTAEWRSVVEEMFFNKVKAWKIQWAARVVQPGCGRCGNWAHVARECTGLPREWKPFCDECVAFFDTDTCQGPHGRARVAVRGRCMICCNVRIRTTPQTPQRTARCPECNRTGSEQLWALPTVPKFTWDPEVLRQYSLN
ncbi:uncharacterized protein LOC128668569 [Microplitis demolitor]|uniref:uncharacterized protein LOC128668569 n=1 Tax=Microplitis demolitor TaxID=69319 RepID=UPI00235B6D6E|nr:uncharacterized protein LOC128668569 [Microplitis demolitor]